MEKINNEEKTTILKNEIISFTKLENFFDPEKEYNLLYDEDKNLYIKFDKQFLKVFQQDSKIIYQMDFTYNNEIKMGIFNKNIQILCLISNEKLYFVNFEKQIFSIVFYEKLLFVCFLGSPKKDKNLLCILTEELFKVLCIDFSNYENVTEKKYVEIPVKTNDYLYNEKYKILILKYENSFTIINLKNDKTLLKPFYNVKIPVEEINKMYLHEIYNKLYLIIIDSSTIKFFELNNINKIEKKKEIHINTKEIEIQFFDNLIICYLDDNISIYDIQMKKNQLIAKVKYDPLIKKDIAFYNDVIKINGNYYLTNINLELLMNSFKENNFDNYEELFFCLYRRKNNNIEHINYCIYIIEKGKFNSIIQIFKKNIKMYLTSKNYIQEENKSESYIKTYKKKFTYVGQIDFFQIFNSEINIKKEKLLKIICLYVSLCKENQIEIEMEVLIPILINQFNHMKNVSFSEFLIKSKLLPLDISLGFYFIDRYSMIGNKEEKKFSLNLGISILLQSDANIDIKKPLFELIKEKKYIEVINLIHEKFLQDKKHSKKDYSEKKLKKYFYNEINHIYKQNNSNLNLEEFVKNNNYNV